MESAHLTSAHDHARNAEAATYSHNIVVAGTEHDLAASAFRDAAKDTENTEAIRTLQLLENYHHRLAALIKAPPSPRDSDPNSQSASPPTTTRATKASPNRTRTGSPAPPTSSPARTSRRRPPRESTSSIASNLATARGIPGARRSTPTPPVSVANALATRNERQKGAEPETPLRDLLQRQRASDDAKRRKDETSASTGRIQQTQNTIKPTSETGFQKWYSAYNSIITTISAPLAFTSLPLNPPDTNKAQEIQSQPVKNKSPESSRVTSRKPDEPDLESLISKAAYTALKEDRGTAGPFANHESFYMVPTSGGTMSYAGILSSLGSRPHHAASDGPHLSDVLEEGSGNLKGSSHEEFVDARETAYPPSPTTPRHQFPRPRSKGKTTHGLIPAGRGAGVKSTEELELENKTLKALLDNQSKRLQMWEASSQSQYALAQSLRATRERSERRPLPPTLPKYTSDPTALISAGGNDAPSLPPSPEIQTKVEPDPADKARIAELEALLSQEQTTNEKNQKVLGKYREQWEKLKAGARKKEKERQEKRLAEMAVGKTEVLGEDKSEDVENEEEVEEERTDSPGFGKA